jgi:hypothetical protein
LRSFSIDPASGCVQIRPVLPVRLQAQPEAHET